MMNFFRNFVKDERSQNTLEYSVVVGLVVMSGIVVFSNAGSGIKAIWASGNSVFAAANMAAG